MLLFSSAMTLLWIVKVMMIELSLNALFVMSKPFRIDEFDNLNKQKANFSHITAYFAICAVIKDEMDLHEWVSYHHRMGCGHFYLHDNSPKNSTVTSASIQLKDFINRNIVSMKDISAVVAPQLGVYHRCIREHRLKHQFIGMIDADEFIVTRDDCSIPSILRLYEAYGGLALSWMMFGSSGHIKRPSGGILQNYRNCTMVDHVKSIVNTNYAVSHYGNPHQFHYSHGKYAVDSDFLKVNSHINGPRPSLFKIIYLNHYHLKSLEDFTRIRKRGRASTTAPSPNPKNDQYFVNLDRLMKSACPTLYILEEQAKDCHPELIIDKFISTER
jgi:hypothetical protein